MEALNENVVADIATKSDLQTAVERLDQKIDNTLLKHTVAVLFAFMAVGGLLIRFIR